MHLDQVQRRSFSGRATLQAQPPLAVIFLCSAAGRLLGRFAVQFLHTEMQFFPCVPVRDHLLADAVSPPVAERFTEGGWQELEAPALRRHGCGAAAVAGQAGAVCTSHPAPIEYAAPE